MKRALFLLLLLLVLLTGSIWVTAQRLRELPGTIRVRVTEVPVDVIVVDRENRPVLDLKKEDFIVLEDGARQDILHFSLESYVDREDASPPGAPPLPRVQPGAEDVSEAAFRNPQHRTFLLLIGRGRHRDFKAIPKLIDFVRAGLHPTDRVAVMAYNRATDFTTDHQKLVGVLEKYRKISGSIEAKVDLRMSGLAAVYGRDNALSRYQKEIDRIFESADVGSRQVNAAQVPFRKEQAEEDRELLVATEQLKMDEMAAEGGGDGGPARLAERIQTELTMDGMDFDEYIGLRAEAEMDKERIIAAIEYLRFMEGEKHLIFLNDQGVALARLEHDRGLASIASDARVRLHAVQTGGVPMGAGNSMFTAAYSGYPAMGARAFPGSTFNMFALQSVANLSRLTGGQNFAHGDIAKSLEMIERATAASYLLGYVPARKTLDDRFRRIEIRVKRPGLRVMHRRGYYAERVVKPYDRKQLLTYSRTAAAAGLAELIHDVDFSFTAEPLAESGRVLFRSRLTIRPPASIYTLKEDHYFGELAVSYFLFDKSGRVLRETWDDLDMTLKPETYARIINEGLRMERNHEIPAKGGECLLRVVVYDMANDRIGSAEAKLKRR